MTSRDDVRTALSVFGATSGTFACVFVFSYAVSGSYGQEAFMLVVLSSVMLWAARK